MGELILHIGTTKTGSTALQKFFFDNRQKLANNGVYFPEFTQQPRTNTRKNGVFIDRLCHNLARGRDIYQRVNDLDENLERLVEAFSSGKRVLLTDEDVPYHTGFLHEAECPPGLYWRALAQTLFEAGAKNATIVVYLRRQDDWVSSQWREVVKHGWREETLADFCSLNRVRYAMDYAGMIENAMAAFGDNAGVEVRRYDRDSFEGGTIYHDFCTAASIPWDDEYQIPKVEANPSISYNVAEALRVFKETAPTHTPLRKHVLIPLALSLSQKDPSASGTAPFDEEKTRELMQLYLEGNRQISERHLGGEPLFSEEYGGRPAWVPDGKRIAEYHAIFEKAIQDNANRAGPHRIYFFARKLPESIKGPLRSARGKIIRRGE